MYQNEDIIAYRRHIICSSDSDESDSNESDVSCDGKLPPQHYTNIIKIPAKQTPDNYSANKDKVESISENDSVKNTINSNHNLPKNVSLQPKKHSFHVQEHVNTAVQFPHSSWKTNLEPTYSKMLKLNPSTNNLLPCEQIKSGSFINKKLELQESSSLSKQSFLSFGHLLRSKTEKRREVEKDSWPPIGTPFAFESTFQSTSLGVVPSTNRNIESINSSKVSKDEKQPKRKSGKNSNSILEVEKSANYLTLQDYFPAEILSEIHKFEDNSNKLSKRRHRGRGRRSRAKSAKLHDCGINKNVEGPKAKPEKKNKSCSSIKHDFMDYPSTILEDPFVNKLAQKKWCNIYHIIENETTDSTRKTPSNATKKIFSNNKSSEQSHDVKINDFNQIDVNQTEITEDEKGADEKSIRNQDSFVGKSVKDKHDVMDVWTETVKIRKSSKKTASDMINEGKLASGLNTRNYEFNTKSNLSTSQDLKNKLISKSRQNTQMKSTGRDVDIKFDSNSRKYGFVASTGSFRTNMLTERADISKSRSTMLNLDCPVLFPALKKTELIEKSSFALQEKTPRKGEVSSSKKLKENTYQFSISLNSIRDEKSNVKHASKKKKKLKSKTDVMKSDENRGNIEISIPIYEFEGCDTGSEHIITDNVKRNEKKQDILPHDGGVFYSQDLTENIYQSSSSLTSGKENHHVQKKSSGTQNPLPKKKEKNTQKSKQTPIDHVERNQIKAGLTEIENRTTPCPEETPLVDEILCDYPLSKNDYKSSSSLPSNTGQSNALKNENMDRVSKKKKKKAKNKVDNCRPLQINENIQCLIGEKIDRINNTESEIIVGKIAEGQSNKNFATNTDTTHTLDFESCDEHINVNTKLIYRMPTTSVYPELNKVENENIQTCVPKGTHAPDHIGKKLLMSAKKMENEELSIINSYQSSSSLTSIIDDNIILKEPVDILLDISKKKKKKRKNNMTVDMPFKTAHRNIYNEHSENNNDVDNENEEIIEDSCKNNKKIEVEKHVNFSGNFRTVSQKNDFEVDHSSEFESCNESLKEDKLNITLPSDFLAINKPINNNIIIQSFHSNDGIIQLPDPNVSDAHLKEVAGMPTEATKKKRKRNRKKKKETNATLPQFSHQIDIVNELRTDVIIPLGNNFETDLMSYVAHHIREVAARIQQNPNRKGVSNNNSSKNSKNTTSDLKLQRNECNSTFNSTSINEENNDFNASDEMPKNNKKRRRRKEKETNTTQSQNLNEVSTNRENTNELNSFTNSLPDNIKTVNYCAELFELTGNNGHNSNSFISDNGQNHISTKNDIDQAQELQTKIKTSYDNHVDVNVKAEIQKYKYEKSLDHVCENNYHSNETGKIQLKPEISPSTPIINDNKSMLILDNKILKSPDTVALLKNTTVSDETCTLVDLKIEKNSSELIVGRGNEKIAQSAHTTSKKHKKNKRKVSETDIKSNQIKEKKIETCTRRCQIESTDTSVLKSANDQVTYLHEGMDNEQSQRKHVTSYQSSDNFVMVEGEINIPEKLNYSDKETLAKEKMAKLKQLQISDEVRHMTDTSLINDNSVLIPSNKILTTACSDFPNLTESVRPSERQKNTTNLKDIFITLDVNRERKIEEQMHNFESSITKRTNEDLNKVSSRKLKNNELLIPKENALSETFLNLLRENSFSTNDLMSDSIPVHTMPASENENFNNLSTLNGNADDMKNMFSGLFDIPIKLDNSDQFSTTTSIIKHGKLMNNTSVGKENGVKKLYETADLTREKKKRRKKFVPITEFQNSSTINNGEESTNKLGCETEENMGSSEFEQVGKMKKGETVLDSHDSSINSGKEESFARKFTLKDLFPDNSISFKQSTSINNVDKYHIEYNKEPALDLKKCEVQNIWLGNIAADKSKNEGDEELLNQKWDIPKFMNDSFIHALSSKHASSENKISKSQPSNSRSNCDVM